MNVAGIIGKQCLEIVGHGHAGLNARMSASIELTLKVKWARDAKRLRMGAHQGKQDHPPLINELKFDTTLAF
jgi:hypothetical protein